MDEKKGKMNKKKAVFSPSKTHGKSSFLKIKQQIFNELFFDESAKNQSCQLFYNCKSVCYARFLCSFAQAMLIPTHCGIIFPFQTRKKSLFLLIKQHIFNALTFCKNHYQGSFCYSRLILSALHALYAIKICSSCIAPPSLGYQTPLFRTMNPSNPSLPHDLSPQKLMKRPVPLSNVRPSESPFYVVNERLPIDSMIFLYHHGQNITICKRGVSGDRFH